MIFNLHQLEQHNIKNIMQKFSTQITILICILLLGNSCNNNASSHEIPGWSLVWNDEFNGEVIDTMQWTFDLGTGAPSFEAYGNSSPDFVPDNFPKDNFSVRWDGSIQIDVTDEYTFYIISDDGVRLSIADSIIIDNWHPQPPTEKSGTIVLEQGMSYPIIIEYFEDSGGEAIIFGWESTLLSKQLVPSSHLSTPDGRKGLKGTYYENKDLYQDDNEDLVTRVDTAINWVTGGGWGNNESQYYTKSSKNVRLNNGSLIIEAHKEYLSGSNYTSARIKTKNDWRYGRFEIRAKIPPGRGTWSALWALPTDWEYGNWPLSGEIDIMEHVGYDEDVIVTSIHNAALFAGNINGTDQHGYLRTPNVCKEFNSYILEWDEENIIIKVNDEISLLYAKKDKGWERWPFDKRFHLIFNIAVGGNWGGAQGIDDSIFPSKMEIDYVRVYSKKHSHENINDTEKSL